MITNELLSLTDTYLLSIGHSLSGTEWNYKDINSFYNRLYLVLDGEASITHHGQTFHLTPGTVHMVPCYCSADYLCESSFEHYYITFTSRAFGGIDLCSIQEYGYQQPEREHDHIFFKELLRLNPDSTLPVANPALGSYRRHHEDQMNNYRKITSQRFLENTAYINLILAPFLTSAKRTQSQSNAQRLLLFLRYVEEHLTESLSIRDIADHLNVTANYLSDWLAKELHIRPVDHINRRRTERAQELLLTSKTSIKTLGYELGFASTSYFCRVFKKQTGLSPNRYRALNFPPKTITTTNP